MSWAEHTIYFNANGRIIRKSQVRSALSASPTFPTFVKDVCITISGEREFTENNIFTQEMEDVGEANEPSGSNRIGNESGVTLRAISLILPLENLRFEFVIQVSRGARYLTVKMSEARVIVSTRMLNNWFIFQVLEIKLFMTELQRLIQEARAENSDSQCPG